MLWWTLRQLKSQHAQKRIQAVRKLAKSRDRRVVEPLVAALKDPEKEVVQAAAYAFYHISDARAITPLLEALRNQHLGSDVTVSISGALGKIADAIPDEFASPQTVELLVEALKSNVGRGTAMLLLEQLGWQPRDNAERVLFFLGREEAQGAWAVEPIIDLLTNNSDLSPYAAIALGHIGDVRAVDPLMAALRDDAARQEVVVALGCIGDPRAVDPLTAVLKGQERGVLQTYLRQAAAQALGEIGDPSAVEPLMLVLMTDAEYIVRQAAAEALGKIGDPRAVRALLAMRGDFYDPVREAAEAAVARIGTPIQALVTSLNDSNPVVRLAAVEALEKMAPNVWEEQQRRLDTLIWKAAPLNSLPIEVEDLPIENAAEASIVEVSFKTKPKGESLHILGQISCHGCRAMVPFDRIARRFLSMAPRAPQLTCSRCGDRIVVDAVLRTLRGADVIFVWASPWTSRVGEVLNRVFVRVEQVIAG